MLDAEKVGFDQPGKELADMFYIQVGEGSDEVYLGVNDDEYEDTHIKLV